MDPRQYHYQYRRPRHNNPTFASFNVNNSMTFFMNGPTSPARRSTYQEDMSAHISSRGSYERMPVSSSSPKQYPDYNRERTQSHLSSYGNNSLAFNERQIYNKQNNKFNIISLKPKEVPDQIKQYPKLTLEDRDSYYYQKVKKMRDQQASRISNPNDSYEARQPESVAGKQTFAPEPGKMPNYYQHGRYFTPKMLNHADEVSHIM